MHCYMLNISPLLLEYSAERERERERELKKGTKKWNSIEERNILSFSVVTSKIFQDCLCLCCDLNKCSAGTGLWHNRHQHLGSPLQLTKHIHSHCYVCHIPSFKEIRHAYCLAQGHKAISRGAQIRSSDARTDFFCWKCAAWNRHQMSLF